MRWLAVIALAASMISHVAAAQAWKEYPYPDSGFAVQFPAPPTVEDSTYRAADGTSVKAQITSLRRGSSRFAVTVADFTGKPLDDAALIAQAVDTLSKSGDVRLNIDARIARQFGKELSINNKDGSRTVAAVFSVNKKLYVLTAISMPPNVEAGSGDLIRFQQSLNFIGANGGFGGGLGGGGFGGPGGRRGGFGGNPQAFAACMGKNAGDAVQLTTPGGDVAATCVLVARPNQPPASPDGAPPPREN
jgi:hypothetical protein